ncbi:hypothetical protein HGB47_16915 [Leptospira yasudae]|uniref:hypothetical protein n=1 Tax=Leptospira yasudae TaxID=2202201 RepID=UPI001C4F4848|nr:hypothetical protein [Leptospira yasudae]MBW0435291.1 hypothetical protein [Leptospira yasudae]
MTFSRLKISILLLLLLNSTTLISAPDVYAYNPQGLKVYFYDRKKKILRETKEILQGLVAIGENNLDLDIDSDNPKVLYELKNRDGSHYIRYDSHTIIESKEFLLPRMEKYKALSEFDIWFNGKYNDGTYLILLFWDNTSEESKAATVCIFESRYEFDIIALTKREAHLKNTEMEIKIKRLSKNSVQIDVLKGNLEDFKIIDGVKLKSGKPPSN